MKQLTKKQQESYKNAKICENKYLKDKKYRQVRDHCHYTGEHRGAAYSVCNLKYSVPKKILIVFHNGLNYDYHFAIKKVSRRILKAIYPFRRKHWQIHKLYNPKNW